MKKKKNIRAIWKSAGVFAIVFSLFLSSVVLADEATTCSSAGGEFVANALSGPYAGKSCDTYCHDVKGTSRLQPSGTGKNCCCSNSSTYGAGGSRALPGGLARPGSNTGANDLTHAFDNPLLNNGDADVRVIVGNVIRVVLGIIGSIALVIFLYGGIQWMVSMGDETKINKGRDTMIWAGLGLVIIFGSYTLVQLLLKTVLGS